MPRSRSRRKPKPTAEKPATTYDTLPELLTVEEFRRAYRVGRTAAYGMVKDGTVPVVRLGRHVRIPSSVLLPKAG